MDKSSTGSNGLLSQSYVQGLERLTNSQESLGHHRLSQEIIDVREKVWDNLFAKYSQKLSDDIEINLNSPSEEEEEDVALEGEDENDEEEEDDDEEDDDEEDDDGEYFCKSRTPIRKSQSLIQYWVDTGNAPYQMMDNLSKSESGSSLSEEDCPRLPKYPITTDLMPASPQPKKPEGISNDTSIDTGPYIRSTNITNKSMTMVILEEGKAPDDPPTPRDPLESKDPLEINQTQTKNSPPRDDEICDNNNVSLDKSHDASMILSKLDETIRSLNRSRLNSCASEGLEGSEDSEVKAMTSIMKISDVLPALDVQLGKLPTNAAIHRLKDSEVGSGDSSGRASPKCFPLNKKANRRKLFTGRNSPMDIIVSSTMDSEDQTVPRVANLHPAFQGTPKLGGKISNLKKRATFHARRQSKLFLNRMHSGNGKDSSDPSSEKKEKTFLKTLGLVPTPKFNTKTKRKTICGISRRTTSKRSQKRKVKYREVESDSDEDMEDSSKSSLQSSVPVDECHDLMSLCAKKVLTVPLQRLPDNLLTKNRDKSDRKLKRGPRGGIRYGRINRVDSGLEASPATTEISLRKKKKASESRKIELDSQESDQSTIIMMECEEKGRKPSAPFVRLEKLIINSDPLPETGNGEELTPGDEKKGKKTSAENIITRSKKSILNSEKSQELTPRNKNGDKKPKNKKNSQELTPEDENGGKKAFIKSRASQTVPKTKTTSSEDKKSSPYSTRSRKQLSDPEDAPEETNNGVDGKIAKKLDSRTIRILRRRLALKNQENKDICRNSRKVNAKKIKVKRSKDTSELLEGIDRTSQGSSETVQGCQDDENEEESQNEGEVSVAIGTVTVAIDSDSCSDSTRPTTRRTTTGARRRFSNPIITFSSDDETDFVTKLQKSYEKIERRSQRRNPDNRYSEDQKKIINDLTGEPVFSGIILPSDEEEIYQSSQVKVKETSRRSTRYGSPGKSIKSSKRPSFVRVLSYDDASSKNSEEIEESPPKKFKTEAGDAKVLTENIRKNTPIKRIESDSIASSDESMMILMSRRTKPGGIKRKAELESLNHQENSTTQKSSIMRLQSPIKSMNSLPVVKLLREPPVEKLASIKSQKEKSESVIESTDIELMDLSVSITRIPGDLEKSLNNDNRKSSPKVSPVKSSSVNRPRKSISSGRKMRISTRKVTSDDDSSVDFFLRTPTDNNIKLTDDDHSDIDNTQRTKLFHNPFEDTGENLNISLNRSYERRLSKNTNSYLRKKSVITLRTRDDSDLED
ncbi:uncharacterized protein [Fopius arisanus]|uniref:Uncharacterized protein isoform X1 n=1 Tax=Fopius arisanus TaxID=64838 RepID=A0A9R1T5U5_9HYME|nr:PREDICTED: uncharacterized protein LOC105266649 isoform X1 [Fopius arisanus]